MEEKKFDLPELNREGSIHKRIMLNTPRSDADTPLAKEISEAMRLRQMAGEQNMVHPTRPHVVTVVNQKGGVGKTTSVVNIAAAMALRGIRVLVIDCDPQGNTSTALGIDHRQGTPSIYNVLSEEMELSEIIQPCPSIPELQVAPTTVDLAAAELELVDHKDRTKVLNKAIKQYLAQENPPEVIFIDCPPSLGLLTINALAAGDWVMIPVQAEYYALEGISLLTDTIEKIRNGINPQLRVLGFLITMFDKRTNLASQVDADVRKHFGEKVFENRIPRQVSISEAPSWKQSVLTYDQNSNGATAYQLVALELSRRLRNGEDY